jgi:hypothetical protein
VALDSEKTTDAEPAAEQLERLQAQNVLLARRLARLERGLDSRIVIEQAKGVLAACLDASVREASTLLRRSARSHRMPVRALAAEVVSSRSVPPKVACLLHGAAVEAQLEGTQAQSGTDAEEASTLAGDGHAPTRKGAVGRGG